MLIDESSRPLLDAYLAANEREGQAIRALKAVADAGLRDQAKLFELVKRVEEAHNEKMHLFEQLQASRLDKQ